MSVQMEAVRAFNRIPLFSSLTEDETYEIVRMCRIHRMAAGRTLFTQGADGRSMYLVESGSVDVILEQDGRDEIVAQLGAYDILGELALVSPAPRSATARITSDAVIYEIVGTDFDGLIQQGHPAAFKLARAVSRIVCRRIRSVNERLEAELAGRPAPPPATGQFSAAGAGRASGATPGFASASSDTGMFRKMLSKFWKGGDE